VSLDQKHQRGLIIGAIIGAVLGAGTAYLLTTAPIDETDHEPKPITAKDLLGLTSAAALLLRKLDDVRRRT
jgi:glycerol uptake facilitator-like aquaporin